MTFEEANNILGRWHRGEEPYGDVLDALRSFIDDKSNICSRCKYTYICEAKNQTVSSCGHFFPV